MKYSAVFCLSICCLFSGSAVSTDIEYVEKTVTMDGENCRESIANALVESVRQVRGIDLKSETVTLIRSLEISRGDEDDIKGESRLSLDVSSKTGGYIQSYDVVNLEKSPGECRATITAIIPRAVITADSPAKQMAVLPFRVRKLNYSVGDSSLPASDLSRQLSQEIVAQLSQTRKLIILDREHDAEYEAEKLLLKSDDVQKLEQFKLGQQAGADYLLVGEINDFHVSRYEQLKSFSRQVVTDAKLNVAFRVLDVPQRKVLWADSVESTGNGDFTSLDTDTIRSRLLKSNAAHLAESIMEIIYPIRVMKVTGNSVYLNQGGKRLARDQLLDIYSEGEDIVDPDTGKTIRIDGEMVATIKIQKIMAKYSIGKLVDGSIDEIRINGIVRRHEKPAQ